MASDKDKMEAILRDYDLALEDLTFNSKPIITDLTLAADKYKPIAPRIVEKIENRLRQVCPEHKLPYLYLMDSIVKNLRGVYLELFGKNIVAIFCHTFEKLNNPKVRISLYKLRQTWTPYFPNRKLAAIDRHVHALDPNWPVTATDTSPPSPTIFVNPKFLESSSQSGSTKSVDVAETSPRKGGTKRSKTKPSPPERVVTFSNTPPPPSSSSRIVVMKSSAERDVKMTKKASSTTAKPQFASEGLATSQSEEGLSLQDRRRRLLKQQKKKKLEQQKAMGLAPPPMVKFQRSLTPPLSSSAPNSRSTSPKVGTKTRRSASPLVTHSPRQSPKRPCTASPVDMEVQANHVEGKKMEEGVADSKGKRKDISRSQDTLEESAPAEKRLRTDGAEEDNTPPKPIRKSTLELDDVPSELLPKHQEYMMKQVEKQLKTGNLTGAQHDVLIKQLDQLYDLQRQKDAEKQDDSSKQQQQQQQQPDGPQTQTDSQNSSQSVFHSNPPSDFVHRDRPHSAFDITDRHDSPPPHARPVHVRYPRGGPRSRFRPLGPPLRGRGRGRSYGRPPRDWKPPPRDFGPERERRPPHWVPMETDIGPSGPHPPHHLQLPPPTQQQQPHVAVNDLLSKLVQAGVIDDTEKQKPKQRHKEQAPPLDGPPEQPPLNIPNLSFTPATLKQRYLSLISLLHAGEPCASCGLRFTNRSGVEYRSHLDWHYRINRKESDGTRRTSRNWFMHPEDWLKYEEMADNEDKEPPTISRQLEAVEENLPKEEEETSCKVLPGEGNEVCSICQEVFEQFWEEEQEEWHFRDAMRTGDGKLYHKLCYQDAKESGVLDNSGSQLPSPNPNMDQKTFTDLC